MKAENKENGCITFFEIRLSSYSTIEYKEPVPAGCDY